MTVSIEPRPETFLISIFFFLSSLRMPERFFSTMSKRFSTASRVSSSRPRAIMRTRSSSLGTSRTAAVSMSPERCSATHLACQMSRGKPSRMMSLPVWRISLIFSCIIRTTFSSGTSSPFSRILSNFPVSRRTCPTDSHSSLCFLARI